MWIGDDAQFPGSNRLVYVSPNANLLEENFSCYDTGRYLYIAKNEQNAYFTIVELNLYFTPALCTVCSKDSYCVGGSSKAFRERPNVQGWVMG